MAHILVADDEGAIRIIVRKWLEHSGYSVTVAADGREALALAHQLHPDLIILDIQMPYRSGIEVATELRADPQFANTPIMMISAQINLLPELQQGLFNASLAKPFDLLALQKAVAQLLAP
jgi:CheY-like chemotaxis protein